YKMNGKVRIPVKAHTLDPFGRMKKAGITAWIGNSNKMSSTGYQKYRPPGTVKPNPEPGDGNFVDIVLNHDQKNNIATGEIELPHLESNMVYCTHAYYDNAISHRYYFTGIVYII